MCTLLEFDCVNLIQVFFFQNYTELRVISLREKFKRKEAKCLFQNTLKKAPNPLLPCIQVLNLLYKGRPRKETLLATIYQNLQ